MKQINKPRDLVELVSLLEPTNETYIAAVLNSDDIDDVMYIESLVRLEHDDVIEYFEGINNLDYVKHAVLLRGTQTDVDNPKEFSDSIEAEARTYGLLDVFMVDWEKEVYSSDMCDDISCCNGAHPFNEKFEEQTSDEEDIVVPVELDAIAQLIKMLEV